jgi:hypothetical protein
MELSVDLSGRGVGWRIGWVGPFMKLTFRASSGGMRVPEVSLSIYIVTSFIHLFHSAGEVMAPTVLVQAPT